ncbi:MAG: DegV family protein [Romboutsia sp.]|uniref:DegV family protein n=1 Tax=Romboutsia sp. TaxID=1965302 RepID=UPI003F2F4F26
MKIKLICDSLCDVPEELVKKYNIEVIPLTIIMEEKEYKDGVDINNKEFYDLMRNSNTAPKTSQVTYIQFKEVFDKYIGEYEIVCITGSSKSSGTYQSAMMAKNDTEGKIEVFDTLTLSLGSAQYVIKACELLNTNIDSKEMIRSLESIRESVSLYFVVNTLEYLKRSGRVSMTTATIGNMLNLKPIFSVKGGNILLIDKIRGKKHAIHTIINLIKDNYDSLEDKNLIIGYGSNESDFEELKKEVEDKIKAKSIYITRGGACICSHTGPEILAISCSN